MGETYKLEEASRLINSLRSSLQEALNMTFKVINTTDRYASTYLWVEDIIIDTAESGFVIVQKRGEYYQIGYTQNDDGTIAFADTDNWAHVYRTYMPFVDSSIEESDEDLIESSVSLTESKFGNIEIMESGEGDVPMKIRVQVIEPGWGNSADNNYYPKNTLKEYSSVFNGMKMYATNHKASEKNVLTEVSEVLECPVGFTEDGAPIAVVGIINNAFAEMIRNRKKLGILENLHCSILAEGTAIRGFKENGRTGMKITSITKAHSIDWVTKAGAGGHALEII